MECFTSLNHVQDCGPCADDDLAFNSIASSIIYSSKSQHILVTTTIFNEAPPRLPHPTTPSTTPRQSRSSKTESPSPSTYFHLQHNHASTSIPPRRPYEPAKGTVISPNHHKCCAGTREQSCGYCRRHVRCKLSKDVFLFLGHAMARGKREETASLRSKHPETKRKEARYRRGRARILSP